MQRLTVGRMPHATKIRVVYEQTAGRHRRHTRRASTRRQLRSLIRWLKGRRYRPGDRLEVAIRRAGYVPERATFTIRNGREPELTP
jgi:Ni/Co efflux regulator RcnB